MYEINKTIISLRFHKVYVVFKLLVTKIATSHKTEIQSLDNTAG